ncbi:MAG: N-acetyl-gamma-glutamyl-phosphate reductase [Gammaproteobacteria bacterium]|nr:N-acetyl-gamma-glutamyl-phosphate reductase [Gammaproteobacteria bacterium]
MVNVGIVGATGYTGVELLRLLIVHPQVELRAITSRSEAGRRVDDLYPSLRGYCDLQFVAPDAVQLHDCEIVFFATPNGTAMHLVPALLDAGVRVIDLAADFRFRNADDWQQWYGEPHACPDVLSEAVYGLPEVQRDSIASARVVGNPGCYPTSVQLGFIPLLEQGVIDPTRLIADAKSGVSGAGRGASVATLFSEAADNLNAYGANGHRHQPEIEQGLRGYTNGQLRLTFVPHLTPMIRGIHATLYAELSGDTDVQALYETRYRDEPFVDVMPSGSHPQTRGVRGSNVCRLAVHVKPDGRVIVLSVIDNLVKGAAGQAVQNMNIMCGLEETAGLDLPAVVP